VGHFGVGASLDVDAICCESGDVFIEVHDFHETPTGTSCVNVVAAGSASSDLVNNISPNPLDTLHAFSSCSRPFLSLEDHNVSFVDHHDILEGNVVDYLESLGTFREYDPSLYPYNLYLETMPMKMMLTTIFDYSADFSAFDKFTRALTAIPQFMFRCCYSHPSKLHAQVFDKLLRTLTTSELVAWILR